VSVEADIVRTAKLLMNQYGEHATTEAAERAAWLLKRGDADSVAIWRRVHKTLEALQRAPEARNGDLTRS
jgi:hypothetical protein